MQYLKEEIKFEIMRSALNEFKLKGFEKASMKNIAHNAGVSTGNIYIYVKNKEKLFDEIMEPVYSQIEAVIFNQYQENQSKRKLQFNSSDVVNSIMEIYASHGTQLMIMMNKSQGTKYENAKHDLINLVYKRLKFEYMPILCKQGIENLEMFIYVFASVLVDGMFIILDSKVDIDEKKRLINQVLIFYFNKLDERFS